MKSTVSATITVNQFGTVGYHPENQIDDLDIDWGNFDFHEPILEAIKIAIQTVKTEVFRIKEAKLAQRDADSYVKHIGSLATPRALKFEFQLRNAFEAQAVTIAKSHARATHAKTNLTSALILDAATNNRVTTPPVSRTQPHGPARREWWAR